jgi:peptidoglycan/LPS O-acetylase OafA/YrhL
MGYIKQLDSVRAIAVFMVIIWHWIPRTSPVNQFFPGPIGVNLFFVLSGFLITQILLDNRIKAKKQNASRKTILRSFYVRRVLRIFPAYYLTIFITFFTAHWLELDTTKGELFSNLTYTSNFYDYFTAHWPSATPHFWSLAVEEQFYLIWPLLMLFLPNRILLHITVLFVVLGFFSQSLITDYEFGLLLPNTCFDCFGAGALLAWIIAYKPHLLKKFFTISTVLAVLTLILFVFSVKGYFFIPQKRFLSAVWGVWIISYILLFKDKNTLLMMLLGNRLLVSIGKVSYGIYLYHILYLFAGTLIWYKLVYKYFAPVAALYDRWLFLAVNFWILYLLCVMSWRFFEKPILSLKKKFGYQKNSVDIETPASEVVGIL